MSNLLQPEPVDGKQGELIVVDNDKKGLFILDINIKDFSSNNNNKIVQSISKSKSFKVILNIIR